MPSEELACTCSRICHSARADQVTTEALDLALQEALAYDGGAEREEGGVQLARPFVAGAESPEAV